MHIFFLTAVPAILLAPWGLRLGLGRILLIWIVTTLIASQLVEIGSRDFPIYVQDFDSFANARFSDLPWQDPLYSLTRWIWAELGGSAYYYYMSLISISILLKLLAFRRLSEFSAIAALLYMCSYFYLHEFTQIRASLAISIWLHAIIQYPKSGKRSLFLILLACTVHIQALLGLIIWPLALLIRSRRGRYLLVLLSLVAITVAQTRIFDQLGFQLIAQIPDARASIYLAFAEQEAWGRPNPFTVLSILSLLVATFGLLRFPPFDGHRMRQDQDLIYASLFMGSVSLAVFAAIAVGAFRISEHFFALLPLAISNLIYQCRSRSVALIGVPVLIALFSYLFLFHSPILVNPATGAPDE